MPENVAYLTCPDCMMPNHVGDDAIKYRCFSCFAEIVFETCTSCEFQQSIPAGWTGSFVCGRCRARVEIPRQRFYSSSTKAIGVKGYGYVYPTL
jgi:hypothetical protein